MSLEIPRPTLPVVPTGVLSAAAQPQTSDQPVVGMSMRFKVVIDGFDLGGWKSCKGLSVSFKTQSVEVGGDYSSVRLLPDRMTYSNVTLQRAMTLAESARVQSFLREVSDEWFDAIDQYSGRTAKITLLDYSANSAKPVASWSLRNVYPASWKGPDLDSTATGVAVETLELIHEGFL